MLIDKQVIKVVQPEEKNIFLEVFCNLTLNWYYTRYMNTICYQLRLWLFMFWCTIDPHQMQLFETRPHRAITVASNHYNMTNATQGNSHNATNTKQCNNCTAHNTNSAIAHWKHCAQKSNPTTPYKGKLVNQVLDEETSQKNTGDHLDMWQLWEE